MKKATILFEQGKHKWFVISRDPQKPDYLIDTNEYLVVDGVEAMLLDPGGSEIFPAVFSAISAEFNDMLCPQHGAINQGQDVKRFIDWFSELKVGTGIM